MVLYASINAYPQVLPTEPYTSQKTYTTTTKEIPGTPVAHLEALRCRKIDKKSVSIFSYGYVYLRLFRLLNVLFLYLILHILL